MEELLLAAFCLQISQDPLNWPALSDAQQLAVVLAKVIRSQQFKCETKTVFVPDNGAHYLNLPQMPHQAMTMRINESLSTVLIVVFSLELLLN